MLVPDGVPADPAVVMLVPSGNTSALPVPLNLMFPATSSLLPGLVVPIPRFPPFVILIRSAQLVPFHDENTMSFVDAWPGAAIPNATAAVGSPPVPVWFFQNSISPLPPTKVSGDFVPGATTSNTWLADAAVGCPPNVVTLIPPLGVSSIDESPSVPVLSIHFVRWFVVPVPTACV